MKSNASAGFMIKTKKKNYGDYAEASKPKEVKVEKSAEENLKDLEEEVHRLLEESALLKVEGSRMEALMKAKDAAQKEKQIR